MFFVMICENKNGKYYTIINGKNGFHCHANSHKTSCRILRAAKQMENGFPVSEDYAIRRRALKLFISGKGLHK